MLSIRRLIWDPWNVGHIARHRVTPEEVEEVCHGEPVTSQTYKGRIRVVGPTGEQENAHRDPGSHGRAGRLLPDHRPARGSQGTSALQ
jgi:hypothetical protein